MMFQKSIVVLALAAASPSVQAFAPPTPITTTTTTSTALQALPPPLIIGPMIRKMREEKAKKKMPMSTIDESLQEAPGLRVGRAAWKWPPVWPYEPDFFLSMQEAEEKQVKDMTGMAGMMSGYQDMMAAPPTPEEKEKQDANKFNPLKYWGEELADVRTEVDEDAVEKLKSHFAFYLKDGMSVLELGAAENSYLPDDLKLARHVGVSANMKLMEENPSLTDRLVVDLNKVVEERDVDSDDLRRLASEPFDAIIMTNTIDYLTYPREVHRTCWYLLKPGGLMLSAFSNKDAFGDKFSKARTKAWAGYSDDQHMWISGSFFQFSAGDGWTDLLGFDLSPETAKDPEAGPLGFLSGGKNNNMYVCQATKNFEDEYIDDADPEKYFKSKMWMLPTLEDRDKSLVAPRLRRTFEQAKSAEEKDALTHNLQYLPTIYESLIKMDQFTFTFGMQSQLAVDLISDPDFNGSDEQIMAMKQGLGLKKPSEEFWLPVGQSTAAMSADDKINLLTYIIPRFGSGNPEQEEALQAFVTALEPTFKVIRSKCPNLSESDVQLLGTELLAAEVLKAGRSTREQFAAWLAELTASELEGLLEGRKKFKNEATVELEEYKKVREEEKAKREERQRIIQEQLEKAREVRTMALNPNSGKFELLPSKKDKE